MEKRKIVIHLESDDRVDLVTEGLLDDEAGSLLLQSYLQVARNIVRSHECSNKECGLQEGVARIVAEILYSQNAGILLHKK